ncbi:MAG: hypothetical protein MJZ70_02430 [Bacteroidales bacterium]|nr:hypothetical protein [Bacteroidales bacterium]
MANSFRLKAKKDIHFKNSSDIALGKGMTFEHFEKCSSAPSSGTVAKALTQHFGREVYVDTITNSFEVTKL